MRAGQPRARDRGEGTDDLYKAAFASWTLPEIEEPQADGGAADDATADGSTGGDGEAQVFGQETESDGLLKFILLAIGAGLFTLLMPCTYPMIPITISYFTKQADSRGGKVLPLALTYGLGIVAMFVLIGVLAGPIIQPFATHWITNTIIGVVFVVFALALFGMITLNPPQFMMAFAGQASSTGGYFGVFLMGLTLVVTSFTCTGPFVGSLLAAGADLGTFKIALGMACFGATMATPFVFLALVPGKLSTLPSAGGWMNTVKVFMGFVELAASIKFFSNADIALGLMILPREVFLILWAGIALVAGMYLLGRINLKGESPDGNIGPLQMTIGTGSILMAGYFFLGVLGYRLDSTIMSAMAPPEHYTRGLIESHQGGGRRGRIAAPGHRPAGRQPGRHRRLRPGASVRDRQRLGAAGELHRTHVSGLPADGGFHLPRADVRDLKTKFIEARLHNDAHDETLRERIAVLIDSVAGTIAQPTYVTLDPSSERELARFNGKELSKGEFASFLQASLDAL